MTKAYTIDIPESICDEALEWAKENCPSYITNTTFMKTESLMLGPQVWQSTSMYFYKFFFYKEKDAAFFALKWSSS